MSRFLDMTSAPAEYANDTDFAPSETLVTTPSQATPRSGSQSAPPDRFRFFQYVLLVYLFFYCSRVSEVVPGMRFAIILLPILLIGLFLSGRTKAILGMRSGKALIAFTIWIAACIPTSLWHTGSLRILRGNLIALFIVVVMAAFIRTVRDCFRLMYTVGLSMGLVAIMGLVLKRSGPSARLGLGDTATLQDPNFFCLYLLVGVCFLSLSVSVHKGFKRLLSIGLIVLCLGAAARSGSRMGLVAFAITVLMFFIFGNMRHRIYLVLGCLLLVAVVPPMLPPSVRNRFTILFQPGQGGTKLDVSAADSAMVRRRLLVRSLQFTFEYPLFGVGPGQFIQAEYGVAREENRKGMWMYSHNAYTETSSETGIIGGILFVVAFLGAQVGLRRIRKYGPDLLTRRMALFMHLALIVATLCALFLTLGYSGIIWVLIGASGTFQLVVARQAKLAQAHQGNQAR